MSATLALALLLQLTAIVALRYRLGRPWLRRPVVILVLACALSQGVTQALLLFPSVAEWDTYLSGVPERWADAATLAMSVTMLAFTVAYLMVRPERVDGAQSSVRPGDVAIAARALDWRLMAALCVPLTVLTAEGQGYNNGTAAPDGATLSVSLSETFFIALAILASAGFLLRHGTRWFLAVLAVQSTLLALAGERTPVVVAAIALTVVLLHAGVRVPRAQVVAAGLLTLVAILAISGERSVTGRDVFYQNSGAGARLSAVAGGLTSAAATAPSSPGLLAQTVIRLNDTEFAAAILQSEHLGQGRVSASYAPESLGEAVPSLLWKSKLSGGYALASPAQLEMDHFGLQQINWLPGLFGTYTGMLSPAQMTAFFALVGLVAGWGEKWIFRRSTPARLALLAEAVIAAGQWLAGLPAMVIELRTGVVLAVAVSVLWAVRSRRRRNANESMRVPSTRGLASAPDQSGALAAHVSPNLDGTRRA